MSFRFKASLGATCIIALLASGIWSTSAFASTTSKAQVAAATASATKAENLKAVPILQTSLKSKPPQGGLVVFLVSPETQLIQQGVEAAAAAAGWTVKSIAINLSDPSTVQNGMASALAFKPYAVLFSGPLYSEWSNEVAAYEKAGVQIVPDGVGPVTESSVLKTVIGDSAQEARDVAIEADWFTSASKGHGKALDISYAGTGFQIAHAADFAADVKKDCPGCTVKQLALPVTDQLSGTTAAIVSTLSANPSIKYVDTGYGAALTGMPASLSAAGLKGIKFIGYASSPIQMQEVQSGTLPGGWVATDQSLQGWIMFDTVLRIREGMKVLDSDGGVPYGLVTAQNVGAGTITDASTGEIPSTYAAQFKKLWHLG